MLHDPSNRFLRDEAAELATGGGAAAALALLPDPVAAVDPAAEVPREPTLLEKARAAFQSKAAILAESHDAQGQLAEAQRLIHGLQTEKAGLAAQVDVLTGELATLRTEQAEISALLDSAKAASATAEERAVDIVAAVGFPAAQLPAAEMEMEDTVESLTAKMEAATDATARWTLSRKISAMRWK